MIELESVRKVYRTERVETLALQDVDMKIDRGEFVSVMGPSGCGKSTLLNLIGLLDAPSGGSIRIEGEEVAKRGDRALAKLRNRKLGFVFQSFHLVPDLSVMDNVQIPLLYRSVGSTERKQLAKAALEHVGLGSRLHHYPSQLSGGQQQRVAIARAIVGRPDIILADEPTGNLDSNMGDEIMSILRELNGGGTTIVMVTHDPRMAEQTHRTVRLFDGRQVN